MQRAPVLLGVGAAAASVLVFEVVLTRVFAVAQFYHFAFLTVSLALLGFGASGSALAAFPRLGRGGPRRWAVLAAAQAATTVGAYVVVNELPFDSFSIAWDRRQVAYLAAYYFALTVPFFFGGAVIGTLLAGWDQPVPIPSRRVYAATLAGSGVGALVALGALGLIDGPAVVLLAAALAALAAVAFELVAPRSPARLTAWSTGIAVLVVLALAAPAPLRLDLSPYKGLSAALRLPDAELVTTEWGAAERVDHVRSASIRSLPGLSFAFPGGPPPQDGVTFDGDDLAPVPRVAAADADFVPFLLGALPFTLRPGGAAAVLQPRGGLDVLVARAAGAGAVTAVEPSRAAVAAAAAGSPDPYDGAEVVAEEPRAFAERTPDRFDVVDLALTSPYRPVSSGAYSLAEDYSLTMEAFDRYFDLLRPGGIVAAIRWAQTPPSEETRLLATVAAALRERGADPATSLAALRGYATVLVLAAPEGLDGADVAAIRAFAATGRFDLVALPGLRPEERNRYNVLPDDEYSALAAALLEDGDPGDVYAAAEFDVRPATDDRPFFGHYFRWGQAGDVLEGLGRTWQPFGGAGYFVLLALLALSVVGALALIVAPLLVGRVRRERGDPATTWWTLGYFGLLGIAFLFVEIPIIQRYILLVGRPTTAVAVVLFALLVASGAGSLASARLPWRAAAAGVVALSVAQPLLLPPLTSVLLPAPGPVRMLAGGLALAPLGFLMGTMFPRGLAHLEGSAPSLVPWAWGVNGTASVISAAAAAVLALSFGFRFVILAGAACYAGAALLARPALPGRR